MTAPNTAVVTGANSGLGLAITKELCRRGYQVVMACRNLQKAEAARAEILEEVPSANALIMELDISDLDSVKAFSEELREQIGALDLLINNAGIVALPFARNKAGHEMQFATNYLGAFALSALLLPLLREQAGSRIVNVGSLAHRFGKLELDNLNWEKGDYKEMAAYARSKVALMSFTLELNRRLQASGSPIIALAAHPGFANTNAGRGESAINSKGPLRQWFQNKVEPFIPTAAEAARPILLAACDNSVRGGDFYGPRGLFEIAGKPGKAKINRAARNPATAEKLWELSEDFSGIRCAV